MTSKTKSYEGILTVNSMRDRGKAGIMYEFVFLTMDRQFIDYFKAESQKVKITIEVLK